jgi:NADH:ubiquinone oxidoreductase subunit 5 (subunit L)/multisubunit Na+/H+ antiporter MnhA subunit
MPTILVGLVSSIKLIIYLKKKVCKHFSKKKKKKKRKEKKKKERDFILEITLVFLNFTHSNLKALQRSLTKQKHKSPKLFFYPKSA